jgi:hypothetical protein
MRFFLSIRGELDYFIAPFCRSTKCFGPVWKFHTPLECPSYNYLARISAFATPRLRGNNVNIANRRMNV